MKKKQHQAKLAIGIAWYRPEDWKLLHQISIDSDKLEETYKEWELAVTRTLNQLKREGAHVEKVHVDLAELIEWCKERNLQINASSRSQFAVHKIRLKYTSRE